MHTNEGGGGGCGAPAPPTKRTQKGVLVATPGKQAPPGGGGPQNRGKDPMLAINFQQGLTDAWDSVATFVPKLVGFLLILLIGYLVARVLASVVDRLLERVGFDRWVERGSFGTALQRSSFDASDILAKL